MMKGKKKRRKTLSLSLSLSLSHMITLQIGAISTENVYL